MLLGTAHISKESAAQVKAEIASGDYDAIAVELCENRHNNMRNPDQFANTDLWQVIRQGKIRHDAGEPGTGRLPKTSCRRL